MAQVSATSASSLALQMEDVSEKMFDHMVRTAPELKILNLVTKSIDGKYLRVDFQTDGNAYLANRLEHEYFPGEDPSASADDAIAGFTVGEMLFRQRHSFIGVDWTGQMKAAAKSRKGAYMNLADFRMDDTKKFIQERMCIKLATSQVGSLARIQTISGTAVTFRYAGYSAASTQTYENGSRYLRNGLVLDAIDGTSGRLGALRQGVNDTGVALSGLGVDKGSNGTGISGTLSKAPTSWAIGDYVTLYNERSSAANPTGVISSAADWNGLKNTLGLIDAVDDGNLVAYYGELQRSSYPSLNALTFGNSGTLRPLTQQIINWAAEQQKQLWDGMANVAYSTPGVMRRFVDFLTIQGSGSSGATATNNPIRYDPSSTQSVGFNKISLHPLGMDGTLDLAPSRLAPHHMMFLLDRSSMVLVQDSPPRFVNEDGMTIRKVAGKWDFVANWVWPATGIVAREPAKNVRIDDLEGDHMTAG